MNRIYRVRYDYYITEGGKTNAGEIAYVKAKDVEEAEHIFHEKILGRYDLLPTQELVVVLKSTARVGQMASFILASELLN